MENQNRRYLALIVHSLRLSLICHSSNLIRSSPYRTEQRNPGTC